MTASRMVGGSQVSETANAQLMVEAINGGTPDEELQLDILHRPEAVGNENVAYIAFGVPGTSSYVFYDLNKLPGTIKVCVSIERDGVCVSKTEFSGDTGNTPQAP